MDEVIETYADSASEDEKQPLEENASATNYGISEPRYTFVRLCDLYSVLKHKQFPTHLQTVGFMKCESSGYKLYPLLLHESNVCVSLQFNTFINNAASPNMYVRIYGFCLYYTDERKLVTVCPEELHKATPYVEIRVSIWLNLNNLQIAHRTEEILYRINNSNKNV